MPGVSFEGPKVIHNYYPLLSLFFLALFPGLSYKRHNKEREHAHTTLFRSRHQMAE